MNQKSYKNKCYIIRYLLFEFKFPEIKWAQNVN